MHDFPNLNVDALVIPKPSTQDYANQVITESAIMLFFGAFGIMFFFHNLIRYVIPQKRYKSYFTISFYLLAGLLLISDVIMHSFYIVGASMIHQV